MRVLIWSAPFYFKVINFSAINIMTALRFVKSQKSKVKKIKKDQVPLNLFMENEKYVFRDT